MRKIKWKDKSLAIAILVLLAVVLNPELRAFLLVLDFLGADLILLLLGGYISQYWPTIAFHLRSVFCWFTAGASSLAKSIRWIAYGLHPHDGKWAQIDHIGIAGGVAVEVALGRFDRHAAGFSLKR